MDKVFGYDRFLAEIVWHKNSGGIGRTSFSKRHDVLLQYAKGDHHLYDGKALGDLREKEKGTFGGYFGVDDDGRDYRERPVIDGVLDHLVAGRLHHYLSPSQ